MDNIKDKGVSTVHPNICMYQYSKLKWPIVFWQYGTSKFDWIIELAPLNLW